MKPPGMNPVTPLSKGEGGGSGLAPGGELRAQSGPEVPVSRGNGEAGLGCLSPPFMQSCF